MPDEAPPPWHLPAWAEPFRKCFVGVHPNEIEAVINTTKHRTPDGVVNAMMVECQVKLLSRLMAEGLLLVEKPARKASELLQ
jgi:predicted urease superfamily metal-dependent hydrolase